jgi:hypothetical protein
MRSKIILCLKTAWVIAAFMTVLVATTVCGSADHQACSAAGNTMFLFMLVLSFPLGLVFLLISLIFFDGGGGTLASEYALTWFIMLCGGCCQWFVLVPRLFGKPQFILLDLRTPAREISKVVVALPAPVPAPRPAAIETIAASRRGPRPSKPAKRIKPFDRLGRTPLERVIER